MMMLSLISSSMRSLRFSFSCEVSLRANLFSRFNAIIAVFGNGSDHLILLNSLDSRFSSCDSVKGVYLFHHFSLLAIQIQPSLYFRPLGVKCFKREDANRFFILSINYLF